ncbi:MAG TPA: hypothetical protein VMA72_00900 [Streptosporangiaceae bacterium]|nr:hypothetical protein [Streptosporangiaceae bacterium]
MSAAPALADYAPGANDVVGGGSDTLQYILDFGADGDVATDPGYNDGSGVLYKLVSMDATADSNARFSWQVGASLANAATQGLDPTAVYRGQTYPQERINGSGAGISALLADTSALDPTINFARMSSQPTAAEGAQAATNGWQGLQDFVLGNENLRSAADLTNNIPCDTATGACASGQVPGLSGKELGQIFEANLGSCLTWASLYTENGQTPPSGVSTDVIIPILPQAGSGTRSTFLADLGAALGLSGSLSPGTCAQSGEENDPTAITSLSSTTTNPVSGSGQPVTTCTPNCAYDAIEPFSGARLNLYSGVSGNTSFGASVGQSNAYFRDPTVAYPNSSANVLKPGIEQLTGTPVDGTTTYTDTRNLNVVYRWTDQISKTPWQPGGSLNWAETLFCDPGGPTPFFQTTEGKLLIAEAGGNPATQSCLSSPLN